MQAEAGGVKSEMVNEWRLLLDVGCSVSEVEDCLFAMRACCEDVDIL
jgi:hypothetical protein